MIEDGANLVKRFKQQVLPKMFDSYYVRHRSVDDEARTAATAVLMSVYITISKLARTCVTSHNEDAAKQLTTQYMR